MLERLLLFSVIFTLTVGLCPIEMNSGPCNCMELNDALQVRCTGLTNEQDLARVIRPLNQRSDVFSITIADSALTYIPSNAFKGMKFKVLSFSNCSLMSLTETDVAFEGLEDSLASLMMMNCKYMNDWDWSIFRELKKFTLLSLFQDNLVTIESMQGIIMDKLSFIILGNQQLTEVPDYAFSGATNLAYLNLNNNKISQIKRNIFPYSSNSLNEIHLGNNYIEKFPDDMFTNMPNLQWIDVKHNKLLFLDEKVFKPVWDQLYYFRALGNDLTCDCRMKWILSVRLPSTVAAVCSYPDRLSGIDISKLSSKHFWC